MILVLYPTLLVFRLHLVYLRGFKPPLFYFKVKDCYLKKILKYFLVLFSFYYEVFKLAHNGKCMLRTGCGLVSCPVMQEKMRGNREPGICCPRYVICIVLWLRFLNFFPFLQFKTGVLGTSPLAQTATLKYRLLLFIPV